MRGYFSFAARAPADKTQRRFERFFRGVDRF
jgi:hypothetical protein